MRQVHHRELADVANGFNTARILVHKRDNRRNSRSHAKAIAPLHKLRRQMRSRSPIQQNKRRDKRTQKLLGKELRLQLEYATKLCARVVRARFSNPIRGRVVNIRDDLSHEEILAIDEILLSDKRSTRKADGACERHYCENMLHLKLQNKYATRIC